MCEALTLCYLVILSKDENVFIAFAMTCAIVVGLTVYAFYTKTDFTYCGGLLFMLLLGSIGFGILVAIFPSKIGNVALGFFGAILGGLYLIYDT